jgi:hypothetical protein
MVVLIIVLIFKYALYWLSMHIYYALWLDLSTLFAWLNYWCGEGRDTFMGWEGFVGCPAPGALEPRCRVKHRGGEA